MFLFVGVLVFVYCYMAVYIRGKHVWQLRRGSSNRGIPGSTDDTSLEVGINSSISNMYTIRHQCVLCCYVIMLL